jgi:hypothetical protein
LFFRLPQRAAVTEQNVCALPIFSGPQLERGAVVPSGGCERVERKRPVAGRAQGDAGALREEASSRSVGVLERSQVVVREQLGEILGCLRERLDSLGRPAMLLGALRAWDLPVGDVADEHVPEGKLVIVTDRRVPLAPHELLARQGVQTALEG